MATTHGARNTGNPLYPPNNGPPYVIRLDTVPHFNPNMIGIALSCLFILLVLPGGVEAEPMSKPIDPPPSYDQALLAPVLTDPPSYSEQADADSELVRQVLSS